VRRERPLDEQDLLGGQADVETPLKMQTMEEPWPCASRWASGSGS
jgi:hypothetical protein